MRVSYTRNEDDRVAEIRYMVEETDIARVARKRRRSSGLVTIYCAVFMLCIAIGPPLVLGNYARLVSVVPIVVGALGLAFLAMGIGMMLNPQRAFVRQISSLPSIGELDGSVCALEVTDRGVRAVDERVDATFLPPAIVGVHEDSSHIYIRLWKDNAIVIPARAFASDTEREAFADAVRALLPDVQGDEQPGA